MQAARQSIQRPQPVLRLQSSRVARVAPRASGARLRVDAIFGGFKARPRFALPRKWKVTKPYRTLGAHPTHFTPLFSAPAIYWRRACSCGHSRAHVRRSEVGSWSHSGPTPPHPPPTDAQAKVTTISSRRELEDKLKSSPNKIVVLSIEARACHGGTRTAWNTHTIVSKPGACRPNASARAQSESECFLGDSEGWAQLNEDACAKLSANLKKAAEECKDGAVFLTMKGVPPCARTLESRGSLPNLSPVVTPPPPRCPAPGPAPRPGIRPPRAHAGDASKETQELAKELGVKVFPTIQYYRDNNLLYATEGGPHVASSARVPP